jgi:hypothetical protein
MKISTLIHLLLRLFLGLVSLFTITACTVPGATIQLGGSLNVFSTEQLFDNTKIPDDWIVSDSISKRSISAASTLGTRTVKFISAANQYHFVRRVKASLLATPYLSWRWKLQPGKWKHHPIRIIVGFADGNAFPKPPTLLKKKIPETSLPTHDRMLSFLWAPSALMRGNLNPIPNSEKSTKQEAHYVVRGGTENVGFWWHDTVDLASLYNLSWPNDGHSLVQVQFIGIDSATSQSPITTYISDLRLSR